MSPHFCKSEGQKIIGHSFLTSRGNAFVYLSYSLSHCTLNFDLVILTLNFDLLYKKLTLAKTFEPEKIGLSYFTMYSIWEDLSVGTIIFNLVTLTFKLFLLLFTFCCYLHVCGQWAMLSFWLLLCYEVKCFDGQIVIQSDSD